jgi:hypothetical protein
MNEVTQTLEPFVGQWAVLLITYKRDGTPVGTAVNIAVEGARARVLEGEGSACAGRLLARKYPALHSLLVPLVHRLRGNKTMHVELTPAETPSQTTSVPPG